MEIKVRILSNCFCLETIDGNVDRVAMRIKRILDGDDNLYEIHVIEIRDPADSESSSTERQSLKYIIECAENLHAHPSNIVDELLKEF